MAFVFTDDKVHIVEYNPDWVNQFQQEKKQLKRVFTDNTVKIEHIGSTAVKDLGAKPVIDIMIGLNALEALDDKFEHLSELGYVYGPEFEKVIPERRFFYRVFDDRIYAQIHIVELDTVFWEEKLLFRNYLREKPERAQDYYRFKLKMAKKFRLKRTQFSASKSDFIQVVLAEARECFGQ